MTKREVIKKMHEIDALGECVVGQSGDRLTAELRAIALGARVEFFGGLWLVIQPNRRAVGQPDGQWERGIAETNHA